MNYPISELRTLARTRIRSGELPCTESPRVWAGPGRGAPCGVCEVPVASPHTEYEVEVTRDGVMNLTLHFHILCHHAWAHECDKAPLAPTG